MKTTCSIPLLFSLLCGVVLHPAYGQIANPSLAVGQAATAVTNRASPDLQITNVVFPATFNQMDRVDFSFALKNNGPGLVSIPANLRFYSVRVDDRERAGFDAWQPRVLGPGESIPFSGNLPIARDWFPTAGVHTLTITADPNNRIAETNENNNTATQSVNVAALPTSDVIFGGAVIDPPNPTTTTPFKVIVTVTNRGPGVATLSGSIIDSPDCPGFNASTSFSLQGGASRTFDLGALPDWYQVGSRTCNVVIGGVQNDPDQSNNRGSFSFTVRAAQAVKVLKALSDLQIANVVFPATFNQADRVDFSFALKNNGPGQVSIPTNLRFYSVRVDDRERAGFDAWQPRDLGPGESIPFSGNLPMARDWFPTAGVHTLTITADPNNRIAELNENNNTATQSVTVAALPTSDVIFGGAVIDPPNPTTTSPFKVIVTVTNRGPGVATLSGSIIDSPDCPGFNLSTSFSLPAGASRTFDLGALRDWYRLGSRTCTVVIGGVQNDPDQSNNRGTFSFTITR